MGYKFVLPIKDVSYLGLEHKHGELYVGERMKSPQATGLVVTECVTGVCEPWGPRKRSVLPRAHQGRESLGQ